MKKILLLLLLAAGLTRGLAQGQLVKGKISDENNKPLAGATVTIKGTTVTTSTDESGNFQINTGNQVKPVLVITFVGYFIEEYQVKGRTNFTIRLQQDTRTLGDVIVVGYGVQRKRDITGASSSVKADEIAKRPLTRLEQALQGTVSGVSVVSPNGQPGQGLRVKIRGANSITGGTEPLYVIDGNIGSGSDVNVADVESIEVLKDAASTAIYGSRGSNGVVLITTKSGIAGHARVGFEFWDRKDKVPKELDLMGPYDFARSVNAQFIAQGSAAAFTPQQLSDFQSGAVKGTDWQKAVQQSPWVQNYQADVSGGSDAVKYYFSFGYLNNPGILINQWYKRTSLRANVDVKLSNRVNVKFYIVGTIPQSHNNSYGGGLTDPWSQAAQWDPTSPIRDASGNYITNSKYASIQWNPVAQAASQSADGYQNNISAMATLNWRILNDLTFTTTDVYSLGSQYNQSLFGPGTSSYVAGSNNLGNASLYSSRGNGYLSSNYFTYKHRFGDHSINITALAEESSGQNQSTNSQAKNLSTYALGYYNLVLGSTQLITNSSYTKDALISYLGRIYYSYKDKYTLSASVRTDGSSHLTQKYSTFPSVGLAWNMKKESFLENSNVFSDLKVRASYGQTGNQAVGAYSSIPLINIGGGNNQNAYYFNGGSSTASVATSQGTPVSQSLKWETKATYDAGADISFLKGRLTFTVDAYTSKISNLLYSEPNSQYYGGGSFQANIGSVSNKGVEFALGGTPVLTSAIRWTTNFTLSINQNKVLNLGGLDNQAAVGGNNTFNAILKVGQPLGEFYGYKFLGTWKTSEATQAAIYGSKPGDAKYADDGGLTGKANDGLYDLELLGNATPKFTFGFINDISYKSFTLSFMFQGVQGSHVFSETQAYLWGGLGDMKNATTIEAVPENLWSPGHETNNPAWSNTGHNFNGSSRYVYNASYVKLKNLSLSYEVPKSLLGRAKINSLRVYVSGQNLLCITPYKGYDPEIDQQPTGNAISQGQEFGVIPNPKSVTFGVRLVL
ncbi:MAG TPA: TonB-dependent receptor [Puia sp.]|jgi:TonB-linked SusC/RagA family outer membrane protein|nr:TonB-dependent receptor [Puia sp.]